MADQTRELRIRWGLKASAAATRVPRSEAIAEFNAYTSGVHLLEAGHTPAAIASSLRQGLDAHVPDGDARRPFYQQMITDLEAVRG